MTRFVSLEGPNMTVTATVLEIIQGAYVGDEYSQGQPDLCYSRLLTDAGEIIGPSLNFPILGDAVVRVGDVIEMKEKIAINHHPDRTDIWLI